MAKLNITLNIANVETLRDICDAIASYSNELNCQILENANDDNLKTRFNSLQTINTQLNDILDIEINKKL